MSKVSSIKAKCSCFALCIVLVSYFLLKRKDVIVSKPFVVKSEFLNTCSTKTLSCTNLLIFNWGEILSQLHGKTLQGKTINCKHVARVYNKLWLYSGKHVPLGQDKITNETCIHMKCSLTFNDEHLDLSTINYMVHQFTWLSIWKYKWFIPP